MNAIKTTTNITECMTMCELQQATCQEQDMQCLGEYIIQGWPEKKDQIQQDIRPYWIFEDDMAVSDGVIRKGRHIGSARSIITTGTPTVTYQHMGIEKKLNYYHVKLVIG